MKHKLQELIKVGRTKEDSDLLPLVNDAPPGVDGRWTAKDQLAHLTAWRQVAVVELDAVRAGGPGPVLSDDDDVENAKIYEVTHAQPAATILEASRNSWDELAAAVEACTEEDLAKPRTRRPEPLWQAVASNACVHLAEHLVYWHSEHGNDDAAEAAARWSHHVASATLPDDEGRGVSAYNLGCFYAVRGRAAEAMPHLREGIELRPDLREWAKQDRDLDPIRSTPELKALIG
jgi:DinB superfamily